MIDIKVLVFSYIIPFFAVVVFLYGLKKFHVKYSLQILSNKEKMGTLGILGVQFLVMMGLFLLRVPMSAVEFAKLEISYLVLLIPTEILIAMAVKNLILAHNKDVNFYYMIFAITFDFGMYAIMKGLKELIFGVTVAMLVYCLSVCIKESFTLKKDIYIVLIFSGIICMLFFWEINLISCVYLLKNLFVAMITGCCIMTMGRMRVRLKRFTIGLFLLFVIGLQFAWYSFM